MARSKRPSRSTPPMDNSVLGCPLTVFYSYAHLDEILRDELHKHLSPLRKSGLIATWHDRKIVPGTPFGQEIDQRLKKSDVVLLLVSPDFLASEYCCIEMEIALRHHAAGFARVIPIILRPCDWQSTPIGHLLALPKDGKPVSTWLDRDEALLDAVKGIRRAVEDISRVRSSRRQVRGAITMRAIRRKA